MWLKDADGMERVHFRPEISVIWVLTPFFRPVCPDISNFYANLTLPVPETKIAEFANSIDLYEVAHNEPPHLGLHCLPSSL